MSRINSQSADVRTLVLQLHDGQGWEALGYGSWNDCVEAEFIFGRQYAQRLLEAAYVDRRLSPTGQLTLPERHVRELAVAPIERQADVYNQALKTAPRGQLTAVHIRETISRMGLAPNRWGERATESNMRDYLEALERLTAPQLEVVLRKTLSSIPSRVLFGAIDEARYMTIEEMSEFNRQAWAA